MAIILAFFLIFKHVFAVFSLGIGLECRVSLHRLRHFANAGLFDLFFRRSQLSLGCLPFFFGRFKLTSRLILYIKFLMPIQNLARAKPMLRNISLPIRIFCEPKICSIRQRTLDFSRLLAFCSSVSG